MTGHKQRPSPLCCPRIRADHGNVMEKYVKAILCVENSSLVFHRMTKRFHNSCFLALCRVCVSVCSQALFIITDLGECPEAFHTLSIFTDWTYCDGLAPGTWPTTHTHGHIYICPYIYICSEIICVHTYTHPMYMYPVGRTVRQATVDHLFMKSMLCGTPKQLKSLITKLNISFLDSFWVVFKV